MSKGMQRTNIPWATHVFNPVSGCSPVSPGCDRCYARAMARRFHKKCDVCGGERLVPAKTEKGVWGNKLCPKCQGADIPPDYFKVTLHPERLDQPLHTRPGKDGPHKVFVCSVSDLFHDDVPDEFIGKVFGVMSMAYWHTFMVLTKRPKRMQIWSRTVMHYPEGDESRKPIQGWPPNVWLGVTAENQAMADERIPLLLQTPAAKRWISYEPALSGIIVAPYLSKIFWLVAGGESGPGARECREEWVQSVYEQCQAAGVPFFFKSGGQKWVIDRTSIPGNGYDERRLKEMWLKRRAWPK